MIRQICMFKLKEENRAENLAEFLRRAESLRALPMMRGYQVVANAPGAPVNNYDVSLICDFDDLEGLAQYQSHPDHVAFGKFVGSVRELRACIDYEC